MIKIIHSSILWKWENLQKVFRLLHFFSHFSMLYAYAKFVKIIFFLYQSTLNTIPHNDNADLLQMKNFDISIQTL